MRPDLYAVVPAKHRTESRTVRGRVLRAEDGEPVAAARVQLIPLGASDWTRPDGHFAIDSVPDGDYTLRVEAAGLEIAILPRLAVSAGMADFEVRLAPDREQLSEVVVSTSRYAVDRAGALGALNIDGDTLAFQPVIGEDAMRALGRLPGIAQNGLSAQSNIRGGESGELLTLLDGFPLRQAFHNPAYQSVFGVIDPGLIGDAVVYTGGFPVRYGNRMGGVFDLTTVDVRPPAAQCARAVGLQCDGTQCGSSRQVRGRLARRRAGRHPGPPRRAGRPGFNPPELFGRVCPRRIR